MPEGQQLFTTPRRGGEIARRAGVPNSAGGRNTVPEGQQLLITPRHAAKMCAAQASKKEASTHALTSFNCNALSVGNGDLS